MPSFIFYHRTSFARHLLLANVSSQPFFPALCLPAMMVMDTPAEIVSSQLNAFFCYVALVMVSYHSNRTVTKTMQGLYKCVLRLGFLRSIDFCTVKLYFIVIAPIWCKGKCP